MIIIPKRQQGYIVPIGFNNAPVTFTVALGIDRTENDADTSPYDSRAGVKLEYESGTDGTIRTGNSPGGGGAIVTWTDDGDIVTPTGYTNSDFEYQWVEISDSGVSAKVAPVAASTWATFNGDKIWYAQQTVSGADTWVIDITVREIADTSNTDTVRRTMNVEGII